LEQEKEAEELGLEDYFQGDGISAIEWADRIPSVLPKELLLIHIAYTGKSSRCLEITAKGKHYEDLVKGCGVKYTRVVNPYDIRGMIREVEKAYKYTREREGGMAVLIARYPCVTQSKEHLKIKPTKIDIRHVPPLERDLPQMKSGAMPQSHLPMYQDKIAPCTGACPIQVDARGYIDLISKGKFDETEIHIGNKGKVLINPEDVDNKKYPKIKNELIKILFTHPDKV
jgi:hypothetical protein